MDVSIQEKSFFDVTISFDSLSSFFLLSLIKNNGSQSLWSVSGEWSSLNSEELEFSQRISQTLDEGNYLLVIQQQNLSKPDSTKRACYSLDLTCQIIPQSGDSGPIVRYVEPPSGTGFNPSKDLYVEIRLSEVPYKRDGSALTRNDGSTIIHSLFLLDPNGKLITASSAVRPTDNPVPDNLMRWTLIFSHVNFNHGMTYQLFLESGQLFSKTGKDFTLPQPHRYTMSEFDRTCSRAGTYDVNNKICICSPEKHRIGSQCENCAPGYLFDFDNECELASFCYPDSCGCSPNSPTICHPLGTCSINKDDPQNPKIVCQCIPGYSGPRCNICAVGYQNYPNCVSICNPPCKAGVCLNATNTCLCKEHFVGETCDQCENGWSGEDCTKPISKSFGTALALVISFSVLLAIGAAVYGWTKRGGIKIWTRVNDHFDDSMDLELEGKRIGGIEEMEENVALKRDSEEDLDLGTKFEDSE